MNDRRRNALILLVVAGLIAASAVVIATKKTRLGLDLKGGTELVYEGKSTASTKVDNESLTRTIDIMRKRVDSLGVAQPEIQLYGEKQISVALPEVSNAIKAQNEVGKTAQLYFYDWEPNVIGPEGKAAPTDGTVTGDATSTGAGGVTAGLTEYEAVLRAAKRPPLLHRNETTWTTGCTAAQGQRGTCHFGTWYLLEPKHEKVLVGPEETEKNLEAERYRRPGVTLKAVHVNPGTVLVQAHPVESESGKIINKTPNAWYVLNDEYVLTGEDVTHPQQGNNEGGGGNGEPNVNFGFTGKGKSIFEAVTKKIAARGREAQLPGVTKGEAEQHFAVVLEGQLITVPSIDFTQYPEGIDASNGSEISGGFTITSAQELAEELQSGALPITLVPISRTQVSATLGKQALNQGLLAGAVGLAFVCLFLLFFYRLLGAIAIGGLAVYGVYFYGLIKLIPVTLTLPGIAGLILTIGVAADANIVIFERVKEEIRGGRSVLAGIAAGYKRGFAAIVDANVVTFMTAFILFALATAEVKGFAFTLGIGTLASLFTAVLATQAALGTMGQSSAVRHPAALGAASAGRRWTFDFMGSSRWFFSLSGTILLVGALAIGGKGLNLGIDFTSGTRIQASFVRPATEEQVAATVRSVGVGHPQIQKIKDASIGGAGYQISTKRLSLGGAERIEQAVERRFGIRRPAGKPGQKYYSETTIGPTFGKTVANSAVIAIIASLLVISAYIALRFEWKYAVPVLIALMHDLLITAGVYSLTGREVTTATVAALLTILGYSLYDTIIVFDRVRENVPRMPRAAFSQIVNRSMSEVLTRSLATSLCTLLPVASLLVFGGETLKDFAFALLIGIASGAYSSIFIASPVLTHWKEREPAYRSRRARIIREFGTVPAYATTAAGAPEEVEPVQQRRRRTRRGSLIAPEEPGQQLSREEFQELVSDLDVDGGTQSGAAPRRRSALSGRAVTAPPTPKSEPATAPAEDVPAPEAPEPAAPVPDPTADLTPEDLVLKDSPKPRRSGSASRRRKHGRSR